MRILLLLIALFVPAYLLMCQRHTGSAAADPGQVLFQPQLERAQEVEQQLRRDLNQRDAEMRQILDSARESD